MERGTIRVSAGFIQISDAQGPNGLGSFCSLSGEMVKIGGLYFLSSDDFLFRAVIAGLIMVTIAAPMGCLMVWQRLVFLSDTLGLRNFTADRDRDKRAPVVRQYEQQQYRGQQQCHQINRGFKLHLE